MVIAKNLYSTLVEDLETTDCFLADQVMGEFPKNTTIPVIDLLSMGSLAQSTSQYAERWRGPDLKWMPKWRVLLEYLKILLAAMRWC